MTAPLSVKTCCSCGVAKPREQFPKPRSTKCSECHISRVCVRCGERKRVEHFPLAGGKKHVGTENRLRRCHPCVLSDKRKYYDQSGGRQRSFRWRYGITLDERDQMLAAQGGRCAICGAVEPGGQGWCTDHDHACCPQKSRSCGECIRGILCFACNVMLGCVRDNPATLSAAVEYLALANVSRRTPI